MPQQALDRTVRADLDRVQQGQRWGPHNTHRSRDRIPRFHAAHGLRTNFRPEPESSPAQRIAPAAIRPGASQDVSIHGPLQIVSSPSTRSAVGTLVVSGGLSGLVTRRLGRSCSSAPTRTASSPDPRRGDTRATIGTHPCRFSEIGRPIHHAVHEVDAIGTRVATVDIQSPGSGGTIDGRSANVFSPLVNLASSRNRSVWTGRLIRSSCWRQYQPAARFIWRGTRGGKCE
jgi:hypothetical protein